MTKRFGHGFLLSATALSLYYICVAEGGAAFREFLFSLPLVVVVISPLVLSVIILIVMLTKPVLRAPATGPLTLLTVILLCTLVIFSNASHEVHVWFLLLPLIYLGPWIHLMYTASCFLAAGEPKAVAAIESTDAGDELKKWKPLVRQFISLGFTDDEIRSNLVSRGLSDHQATDLLAQYRQETQT